MINSINKFFIWENPKNKRYYSAQVKQDLFKDWIVQVCYGTTGTKIGRRKTIYCETQLLALRQLEKIQKRRIKRGYQIKNNGFFSNVFKLQFLFYEKFLRHLIF